MRATAIIPVKRFSAAKQRLLDSLDRRQRAAIVRAMLFDVLESVARCEAIERVVVVTGEGRAERIAMERARRSPVPIEVLRDPRDEGHSQAATLGIVRAKALGAGCVALLAGDCPLLDPSELAATLGPLREGRVAVVPDRHGSGTNALLMAPPDAIGPAFGPGSRERHVELARRRGLDAAVEELGSLALDLDTLDDLDELAATLGGEPALAPATAEALREMGRLGPAAR